MILHWGFGIWRTYRLSLMSAYAAFKGNQNLFFHEEDNEDSNDVIGYQQNSSDESDESEQDDFHEGTQQVKADIEDSRPKSISNPFFNDFSPPTRSIFTSNFESTEKNTLFDTTSLTLGLKHGEYILINGQCVMSILKGLVIVNNHSILKDHSKKHKILASSSQALPILGSYTSTDHVDEGPTAIFDSEMITVIKLESLNSGLEDIGSYFTPFKDFMYNPTSSDDTSIHNERRPSKYTFEIVTKNRSNQAGLNTDHTWSKGINHLVSKLQRESEPQVIMIIGNKNTGKTTFSKGLLNSFLLEQPNKTSYLDIDPGQSEFSAPYTLSLTEVSEIVLGLNIATDSHNSTEGSRRLAHYFGFTSPMHSPANYLELITILYEHYVSRQKPSGNHLIINTPGWIKGYGKEILIEITNLIKPNHLILLSPSPEVDQGENTDILNGLVYEQLHILRSVNQESMFSASQLRDLSKLIYFHQNQSLHFDFGRHLLGTSPLKISYETSYSDSSFVGINTVTNVNFDSNGSFTIEDILLTLDASIVGLYVTDKESFELAKSSKMQSSQPKVPVYLNQPDFKAVVGLKGSKFAGLAIIHSINEEEEYFNMYLQNCNANEIISALRQGKKMLLVKGEGEIPSIELLNPDLLREHETRVKSLNQKMKQGMPVSGNEYLQKLPYINFVDKKKVGGVWKVRRNIMRRSHQR